MALAITWGTKWEATSPSSDIITVNRPGSPVSGDLIVAFVCQKDPTTVTAPDGTWILIADIYRSSAREIGGTVWYKTAGASEPSTYSFDAGGGVENCTSCACLITGWKTDYALEASGNWSEVEVANNASYQTPITAITVDNDDSLVLVFGVRTHATCSGGSTSGYTQGVYESNAGCNIWTGHAAKNAGTTGTVTIAWTDSDGTAESLGFLVQVSPSSGTTYHGTAACTISAPTVSAVGHKSMHGAAACAIADVVVAVIPPGMTSEVLLPIAINQTDDTNDLFSFVGTTNGNHITWYEYFRPGAYIWNDDLYTASQYLGSTPPEVGAACPAGHSGYCAKFTRSAAYHWARITYAPVDGNGLSNDDNRFIFSFMFYADGTPPTNVEICRLRNSSYDILFDIIYTTAEQIKVKYLVSGSDEQLGSLISAPKNNWHTVDVYDQGNGHVGFRVDGGTLQTEVDADTDTVADILFGFCLGDASTPTDHLYITELYYSPDLWSSAADWIDNTEKPTDVITDGSDASYIYSSDLNSEHFFEFEASSEIGEPKAVLIWFRAKQVDSGAYQSRVCLDFSGTHDAENQFRCDMTSSWKTYYALWFQNTSDGTVWDYTDINALVAGLWNRGLDTQDNPMQTGICVSDLKAEVVYGAEGDAFMTHGVYFGAATETTIKMHCRVNEETNVKVLYGSVSEANVKNGIGSWSDVKTAKLSTTESENDNGQFDDYNLIFTFTGLSTNTQYWFDVYVQQAGGYYKSTYGIMSHWNFNYFDTLPSCKTYVVADSDTDHIWCAGGDMHANTACHHQIFASIAAERSVVEEPPRFFYQLGDECNTSVDGVYGKATEPDVMRERIYRKRGFGCECVHYTENITARMPVMRIWSDHDVSGNNNCKIGEGTWYDTRVKVPAEPLIYKKTYNALNSFRDTTPLPDLINPPNFVGTATSGSDSYLVATALKEWQFEYSVLVGNVIPSVGDTVVVNTWETEVLYIDDNGNSTGTMVVRFDSAQTIVNNHTVSFFVGEEEGWIATVNASAGQLGFPKESKYGIYQGQVVHKTVAGKHCHTEVLFVTDTRIDFCYALHYTGEANRGDYSASDVIFRDVHENFAVDALIGMTIYNRTTGSTGKTISDNDATTITHADIGPAWGNNDVCEVTGFQFGNGETFLIYRGGMWFVNRYDNNVFISFDCRSRRDPNGTPGGDKLDGVAYGPLRNGNSKQLRPGGDFADFLLTTNTQYDCTPTMIYHDEEDIEDYVTKWDMVHNMSISALPHASACALIKKVKNASASPGNDGYIELEWALPNMATHNESVKIYESGASDHGGSWSNGEWVPFESTEEADKANINHGHVQRTFVESTLRDSQTDWRFLVTETPLHWAEASEAQDKWANYDGNCVMEINIPNANFTDAGSNLYWYTSAAIVGEPGGVTRQINGTPGDCEKVDYPPNDVHEWSWYDGKVWIYAREGSTIDIWQPSFASRCASRKYIVEKYESFNWLWMGADRHFAALDDGEGSDLEPGPTIGAGPLHCIPDRSHNANKYWRVNGKYSMFDRGCGYLGEADTPDTPFVSPGGVDAIGGYARVDVNNTEEELTVTIRERDGSTASNAHMAARWPNLDNAEWLGDLTMNIIFVSRLVDEEFTATGTVQSWTEVKS